MDDSAPRARGGDRIGSDLTTNHPPDPPSVPEGGQSGFCSRCQAQPGEPCKDKSGKERPDHAARSAPTQKTEAKGLTSQQLREMAERILPSEPLPFVAGAILVIRYRGETPSAESVRAELVREGKTKAQLEGKAA